MSAFSHGFNIGFASGMFNGMFGGFSPFCNFSPFCGFNFFQPTFPMMNFSVFTPYQMPFSGFSMPSMNFTMPAFSTCVADWSTFGGGSWQVSSNTQTRSRASGHSSWKYASMSRADAIRSAEADPNLERLSGGTGWSISTGSFRNDIPFARKGTSAFLNALSREIGENITITSALGTSGSPHSKNSSYSSHYNHENPKLDIGGGLTPAKAESLKAKLIATGYFDRVSVEKHGSTAHLDVQIKTSVLDRYANPSLNAVA